MANKRVINYPEATRFADDDYIILDSEMGGAVKIKADNFEVKARLFKDEFVIERTDWYVDVSEYARRYSKINANYAAVGAFYYVLNPTWGFVALQPFCCLAEASADVEYHYYNFYDGTVGSGGRILVDGKYLYYSDNAGLLDNTSSNINIINANFPLQIINTELTAFADYMTGVRALANMALNT